MMINLYEQIRDWVNANQGVVTIAIFMVTLALGWASGILTALRRKPKFKLSVLDGPTFCCTYPIGNKHGNFECHRTGIAIYLAVANIGSAASSIENISIGYHWNLRPFSLQWLRYSLGWFWLRNQVAALADFQVNIGENIKVYPFLTQKSTLMPSESTTYLEAGHSRNGVVYFEQSDSWGGCFPIVRNGVVAIKVRVFDVFGKEHAAKFNVPSVALEEARKYNPAFGKTLAELHGAPLPFDSGI